MEQIGENWGNIFRLSKITLKEDYPYIGFNGKAILKKGTYFISGFWCDAMGLCETLEEARNINNKFVVPSKALMFFYK